jgi:formylmethanofuran dehydrogenase subunit E
VTVADLVLFHGHACDGLLRGIWAMRALADVAFPDQPFDRSDLLVVSKNSPCLGDLAAYLTGGRARFAPTASTTPRRRLSGAAPLQP